MNPPKKNLISVPPLLQSGALKLADEISVASEIIIKEPQFGDDDGDGPDDDFPVSEVFIDVADNGFLIRFTDDLGQCDKVIVKDLEQLIVKLRKRL